MREPMQLALVGNTVPCMLLTCVVFSVVAFSLRSHGVIVQCTTCMYIGSLCVTQLLVKHLQSGPDAFRFPAWLTASHILCAWFISVVYWWSVGDLRKFDPKSVGSVSRYMASVWPISISLPISIVFNNTALIYIGVGLAAIVSTLTPVTTALLSSFLGRSLSGISWFGIAIALSGAMVISLDEFNGSGLMKDKAKHILGIGLLLTGLAVLLRSVKVVFQDRLLNSFKYDGTEGSPLFQQESVSPMHMWALQAPPMFVISVGYACCTEQVTEAAQQLTPGIIGVILATCVGATCLNLLSTVTIKALGASSMQVWGKLNVITTAAISWGFMGEKLSPQVLSGACVVFVGIIVFEMGETWDAARKKSNRKKAHDEPSIQVSEVAVA